jgi:hypothetical protein
LQCAISDTLMAKSTQHVVLKYALAIILCSYIHNGLDWDEQNHHLLKNRYFQLIPHFHGVLHFGKLPRMEPGSDAQWFGNLTYVLSFKLTFLLPQDFRKHKLSSYRPVIWKKQLPHPYSYPCPLLHWVRKSTLEHESAQKWWTHRLLLITQFDLQFLIIFLGYIALVHLAGLGFVSLG